MNHRVHKWCNQCSPKALKVTDVDGADYWFTVAWSMCTGCMEFPCIDCWGNLSYSSKETGEFWEEFQLFQGHHRRAERGNAEVDDTSFEDLMGKSEMAEFEGGGVRSSDEGKPRFDLLMVSDMEYADQIITRAALRMAEGAATYGDRNHEKMNTEDALARCKSSLVRHVMQYVTGETDEDHLAAVVCNAVMISGIEKRTA